MQMAHYYAESLVVYEDVFAITEDAELVKEVCTKVVQVCGYWSCTRPLADIGVSLLAAKVAANLPSADLTTITMQSLAPHFGKKNLGSLVGSYSNDQLKRLCCECDSAVGILQRWIWSEEVVLSDDLCAVCEEAVLILEDVVLLCRQGD